MTSNPACCDFSWCRSRHLLKTVAVYFTCADTIIGHVVAIFAATFVGSSDVATVGIVCAVAIGYGAFIDVYKCFYKMSSE